MTRRCAAAALDASGLVERLAALAAPHLPQLTARDTTLALDALARLKATGGGAPPCPAVVVGLAVRAAQLAGVLEASQLPLVLWALAVLRCLRSEAAVAAFDTAIARHAAALSPQACPDTAFSCTVFPVAVSEATGALRRQKVSPCRVSCLPEFGCVREGRGRAPFLEHMLYIFECAW
jgi:hypothetical protein